MLELKHISKTYTQGKLDVPVLKNVSFSIKEGEYVAIMGPSGSGKTTLMNLIGCLDYPTMGQYLIDGEDVSEYSENKLADVRLNSIGFVFQSFHLLPRQSAIDNVALPLLYAGVKKKERNDIAAAALERLGLGDRMEFQPNQLSGGQSQRVAIARAIANSPKILLADEPTGALDSSSGKQIMEIFQMLNDEGVTVIMITHDNEIAQHAKRILRIKDGRLVDEDGNFLAPETMEEELGIEPENDENSDHEQSDEQSVTNEDNSAKLADDSPVIQPVKISAPVEVTKAKTVNTTKTAESATDSEAKPVESENVSADNIVTDKDKSDTATKAFNEESKTTTPADDKTGNDTDAVSDVIGDSGAIIESKEDAEKIFTSLLNKFKHSNKKEDTKKIKEKTDDVSSAIATKNEAQANDTIKDIKAKENNNKASDKKDNTEKDEIIKPENKQEAKADTGRNSMSTANAAEIKKSDVPSSAIVPKDKKAEENGIFGKPLKIDLSQPFHTNGSSSDKKDSSEKETASDPSKGGDDS